MKRNLLLLMSLLSFFGCGSKKPAAPAYPADTLVARDGSAITVTFFKHASLAFEYEGHHIYVDPVGEFADYAALPKADVILVTHSHSDHFDRMAVETLQCSGTALLCDKTTAEAFDFDCHTMTPGLTAQPFPYVTVEAVAAYNISEGHTQFHPKEREDCGYIVTLGGTRIYIAGDSENTPEMKALTDIDVAFLPVNQPYTMTVGQAADAVRAMRPKIFYPYHYGQVDQLTDIDALADAVADVTEVRVRPME